MTRSIKYLTIALSLLLSCLFGLSAVLMANDQFANTMAQYSERGRVIYLHRVPDEKASQVAALLTKAADRNSAFIIRGDVLVKPDGSAGGYKFGFYGAPNKHNSDISLNFLGATVFNESNISKLLRAPAGSTLGLGSVAADQIEPLPSFWGGNKVVGVKITDLIDQSGTVNGNYQVIGFSSEEFNTLVSSLAKTLDIPTEKISTPSSGVYAYDALMSTIVYIAIAATWITLLFLAAVGAYQNMGVMGTHLLLGWSRTGFAIKTFAALALSSLAACLLSCLIFFASLQNFPYTPQTIIHAILSGTPAVALTLTAIVIASISLIQIDPVAAIRRRISVRLLAAVLAVFYICANLGVVAGMRAVDGPLQKVTQLHQIQTRWAEYSNLEVLYKEQVGDNASSFSGQGGEHAKEYYDWYQSIEGKDGVYLVNTTYYNTDTLRVWREGQVYKHTPTAPYWEMIASPNYLAKYGPSVDQNLIHQAQTGTRVYLIPDTLTSANRENLEGYLHDYSVTDRESPISTAFGQHERVVFVTYSPSKEMFLWNDDTSLPNVSSDPIILVSTTQNMIPMESESLWANGLTNSYIKLDSTAAAEYLDSGYLSTYGLDDNKPIFLPVSDFVAGLTKSLTETIQLFGAAIALLLILTLIIILGLVRLYSTMRHEEIAVKRLLGYSLWRAFLPPFAFVLITGAGCILIALAVRTHSGVVAAIACTVIQVLLLGYQARKASYQSTADMIKSV